MQKQLGITFVYVTHDQEEALTMSDTIAVIDNGMIQQIGTPENDLQRAGQHLRGKLHRRESNIIYGTMPARLPRACFCGPGV